MEGRLEEGEEATAGTSFYKRGGRREEKDGNRRGEREGGGREGQLEVGGSAVYC